MSCGSQTGRRFVSEFSGGIDSAMTADTLTQHQGQDGLSSTSTNDRVLSVQGHLTRIRRTLTISTDIGPFSSITWLVSITRSSSPAART